MKPSVKSCLMQEPNYIPAKKSARLQSRTDFYSALFRLIRFGFRIISSDPPFRKKRLFSVPEETFPPESRSYRR